jgi:hypothetical protein
MGLGIWLTIEVDTGGPRPYVANLYDSEVTHNLAPMFRLAGCADHLYRPVRGQAGAMIPVLRLALDVMRREPARFRAIEPVNGWGDYDGAVAFLQGLLTACEQHPKATVGGSA